MTTICFQVVKARRVGVKTHCRVCRRIFKRNLTVEQTVNPWNVIEGTRIPKTFAQVYDDANAKVKELQLALIRDGIVCRKCESEVQP